MVVIVLGAGGCRRPEREALLFYEAVCPTCETSRRMEQLAGRLVAIGRERPDLTVRTYDVYRAESVEALRKAIGDLGVELAGLRFPLLIADGTVYAGEAPVTERIVRFERENSR